MHVLVHVQVRGIGVTLHNNDTTQGYAIYPVKHVLDIKIIIIYFRHYDEIIYIFCDRCR